jgi:hypothetical protein
LLRVLLLPVVALLVVAGLWVSIELGQGSGTIRRIDPSPVADQRQSADAPEAKQGGTVCEGTLRRPDPSQPKTFPAIYTKRVETLGITIVADAKVDDQALAEAKKTVERVFKNNDLVKPLVEQGAYIIIADAKQGVLDLPEFGCLQGEVDQNFFNHVCGVADRADYPVATVNELDLLGDRSGPCQGLNILYHEIGHLVQGWSIVPADYYDIKAFYQAAMSSGKYRRQYAATNSNEYFAEATQSYFLYGEPGGAHDRTWLKSYDPDLYALLARVYGD